MLSRISSFSPGFLFHYIFIISQLWLTSHPRSAVVLLDTGTPGTSREIYSEDANGFLLLMLPECDPSCFSPVIFSIILI